MTEKKCKATRLEKIEIVSDQVFVSGLRAVGISGGMPGVTKAGMWLEN